MMGAIWYDVMVATKGPNKIILTMIPLRSSQSEAKRKMLPMPTVTNHFGYSIIREHF